MTDLATIILAAAFLGVAAGLTSLLVRNAPPDRLDLAVAIAGLVVAIVSLLR